MPTSVSEAVGKEYLSTRPPWKCQICKVDCTSEATLLSHASGQKHKRRCNAASAAKAPVVTETASNGVTVETVRAHVVHSTYTT
jgi:hypothetical protein